MSDWQHTTLRMATVSLDSRRRPVKAPDRVAGRYPYYGASGIVDRVDGWLFDETTLLVSEDGENLRSRKTPIAFLASGKYWVNNHAHVLRAADGYDLRFLNYVLQTTDINGYLTGSTQPKLTARNLGEIKFIAPGFDEQRRIASVLTALDDLIDADRSQAQALGELARHLTARTEETVQLGSLATSPKIRQVRPAGRVEHYSLPAYDSGPSPELLDGSKIKSGKAPLQTPTVLVSRLNPKWDRCWMVYPKGNAVASTEFVSLVGISGVSTEEIWAVTSSADYWEQMRSRVTGTTGSHQRVDKAEVLRLDVPNVRSLPSETRDRIVGAVQMIQSCQEEIADLIRIRDELLPLLVSGKVRVDEKFKVA